MSATCTTSDIYASVLPEIAKDAAEAAAKLVPLQRKTEAEARVKATAEAERAKRKAAKKAKSKAKKAKKAKINTRAHASLTQAIL